MSKSSSYARRVLNQVDRPLNVNPFERPISSNPYDVLALLNSQEYKPLPRGKRKKRNAVRYRNRKERKHNLHSSQRSECFYCWRVTPLEDFTVDHVIPVAKGGLKSKENEVGACRECNEFKSDMSKEEFEQSGWLAERRNGQGYHLAWDK